MKNLFPLIILLFCIYACDSSNNDSVGKYVFEDNINVLHVNEDCTRLNSGSTRKGRAIYAKTPIDTTMLLEIDRVCTECVNSMTFEHLRNISMRNKEIDYDRRWLYERLKKSGYDMEEYELFVHHLSDSTKRHRLYSTAQNEGLNVGTYFEFSKLLGFETTQKVK